MTHVTIDLDYFLFDYTRNNYNYFEDDSTCETFLAKVFKSDKSIRVVKEHHHILPIINLKKYSKVVNIDYHSDIVRMSEASKVGVQEGTWANFYHNREEAIFEWRYPTYEDCVVNGYGRCERMYTSYAKMPYKEMGWQKVTRRRGISPTLIKDAQDFTICLSEDWCEPAQYKYITNKFSLLERM